MPRIPVIAKPNKAIVLGSGTRVTWIVRVPVSDIAGVPESVTRILHTGCHCWLVQQCCL
jgi:hypothetical protein